MFRAKLHKFDKTVTFVSHILKFDFWMDFISLFFVLLPSVSLLGVIKSGTVINLSIGTGLSEQAMYIRIRLL